MAHRLLRPLVILLALGAAVDLAGTSTPPVQAESQTCQFVLGFKNLATLIPDVTGTCLEDEHEQASGLRSQATTTGTFTWRKWDNFTAFSTRTQTWINGPYGLQTRDSDERFCWEPDANSNVCGHDQLSSQSRAERAMSCVDVAGPACLRIEDGLLPAVTGLARVKHGVELLQSAAGADYTLVYDRAPGDSQWAIYSARAKQIGLSDQLRTHVWQEQAAVLAHELRHLQQDSSGSLGDGRLCYDNEADALRTTADVWLSAWDNTLPPAVDPLAAELNTLAVFIDRDPYAQTVRHLADYGRWCGDR